MYPYETANMLNMKKIATFLLLAAASSAFALEFLVAQPGEQPPKEGFKTSTCTWGRNLHYKTDYYKTKPASGDSVVFRHGQVVEIDQNVYWRNMSTNVSKLVFSKGHNIKLRYGIAMEMHPSKMQYEKCNIDLGENLSFNYWEKSAWGGIATFELIDTKFNALGGIICIIPVHPEVKFNDLCGPLIVFKGNTQAHFGTGMVVDEIFTENPQMWQFKMRFVLSGESAPKVVFDGEFKAKSIHFDIVNENASLKPGVYPLMTLNDKDSAFINPTFTLDGKSYSLGSSFTVGGKSAKVVMGASPLGRDSKTENDILLIISK